MEQNKNAEPELESTPSASSTKDIKFLSLCMIVGGVIGLINLLMSFSQVLQNLFSLVFLPIGFLFIWHIMKGIDLWRGKDSGFKWAKILFALQIPIISIPGFVYNLYTGILIGIIVGGPKSNFTFSIGGGFNFYLSPEITQTYYGINFFALIALVYLFKRGKA